MTAVGAGARLGGRDALLGRAALVAFGAGAIAVAGAAFSLVAHLEQGGANGQALSRGLGLVAVLLGLPAFALVAAAFLIEPGRRSRRLGAAAAIYAGSLVADVAAAALWAQIYENGRYPAGFFVSGVAAVGTGLALLTAALLAAVGFLGAPASTSRGGCPKREARLGWAAVAFAVSSALGIASYLEEGAAYSGYDHLFHHGYPVDLAIDAVGAGLFLAGGAIAAFAFFTQTRRKHPVAAAPACRDRRLGAAAGIIVLGYACGGVGDGLIARDAARAGGIGTLLASLWLRAGSDLVFGIAAAIAALGLLRARDRTRPSEDG